MRAILLVLMAGGCLASDLQLTLRVDGDRTTFRIGEVIPVSLYFSSSSPQKYRIDMATYDRSGRLGSEVWAVEPQAGWDDPLYRYFHSAMGFIGGGLRGIEVLSAKPSVVREELNEWVRFKQAGQYRVTVTSSRIAKMNGAMMGVGMEVSSNEVVLTIVPATPEWQQETLAAALAGMAQTEREAHRKAVKTLRYLGTEGAARAMARRLAQREDEADLGFGLIGSPANEAALEEMKKLLAAPDFPVTNHFLSTMSVVALPPDANDLGEEREKLHGRFQEELIAALDRKQDAALAVSANTIVEEWGMRSREMAPDLKRTVTEKLIANFDKLPTAAQQSLLEYRWGTLDHTAMLPLLRKVAQRYEDYPELREMRAYESNHASGAALQHWYELDPAGARPAIVQEILRPRPRFSAAVLGMLPDKELPEADQALMEHLQKQEDFDSESNVASLVHRYASGAVEGQVAGYLDEHMGKVACAIQEPLLAYLVKQDPDGARPRLQEAMAARGEGTACYHTVLPEVGKLENHAVLEEIALAALRDADPEVVGGAAAYLMDHGSAHAEEALWDRFTAWSEKWRGSEVQWPEAAAGSNMLQALATGQGWLAGEPKLRRLAQLSVGEQQRMQAEGYLQQWLAKPWTIVFMPVGEGQFQIAQYEAKSLEAAKDKLLQFPAGSTFQWAGDGEKAAKELAAFAAEHGIQITR